MAVAASYVHFQNEKKKKNKNEVNEHYYQIGEKKKKGSSSGKEIRNALLFYLSSTCSFSA